MLKISYLSNFAQKVLLNEMPDGVPAHVSLVAPTIVSPNQPFALKITVQDNEKRPSLGTEFSVVLKCAEIGIEDFKVDFEPGYAACAFVDGITIKSEGFFRIKAEMRGEIFYSNPIFSTQNPATNIYWGDPHIHTILSQCHTNLARSLNYCYTAAKYISGLDWVAAADHVSNGRCDVSKWKEQATVCNLYNEPEIFVTLPAYEASFKSGSGGDVNVYMNRHFDVFADEYDNGNIKTLCEKLKEKSTEQGCDFFVVPHHTTRSGKHGEISDDIYPGEEYMPVMEIHSKWGSSEYRGNPDALINVHKGPSFAVDFLNRGMRLGFIAGTDAHSTMTFPTVLEPSHLYASPGITAVCADSLTRENIYQSIKNRKCYAASLERIYLDVSITEPVKINVTAAAQSDIDSIEIIRNGEVIHCHKPNNWNTSFSYCDDKEDRYSDEALYYYIRVSCRSGAKAWSSPQYINAP